MSSSSLQATPSGAGSSAAGPQILAIALIGAHDQPLFVQTAPSTASSSTGSAAASANGDGDLKWHYAAHTSLDYFEEREASKPRPTDSYLGLLYVMEDYAVYGYQTNTRTRIVLVLALADAVVRDADVKILFRAIHNAYISHVSNPFSNAIPPPAVSATPASSQPMPPIRSRTFERKIDLIGGWSEARKRKLAATEETDDSPSSSCSS